MQTSSVVKKDGFWRSLARRLGSFGDALDATEATLPRAPSVQTGTRGSPNANAVLASPVRQPEPVPFFEDVPLKGP